jgi:hypothetical protein
MRFDSFGPVRVSQSSSFGNVQIEKKYDLCLTTLSWEQRATYAFLSDPDSIIAAVAIWFESTSPEIEDRKSGQIGSLRTKIGTVDELRLSAAPEVEKNFKRLQLFIEGEHKRIGRPLKVLIDISCLPKNYLLFLIGLGFSQDIFACFDCLYSAGRYDLASEDKDTSDEAGRIHRALTSSGKWITKQIPFLSSESTFPETRDMVVSMGGEIGLAVPFVTKMEPTNLSLVFIEETKPSKACDILEGERLAYEALKMEPNASEVSFPLGDVLGVAKHFENVCTKSCCDCVTLIVLGSKSHALAAGIIGMSFDNAEVVCRVPTAYRSLDVQATGEIFFYQIEDRFEPLNYLGR